MVTKLRIERIKKNWSLDEAARATGISRNWYWLIEKKGLEPTKAVATKLERTFNIKIDDLLKEMK